MIKYFKDLLLGVSNVIGILLMAKASICEGNINHLVDDNCCWQIASRNMWGSLDCQCRTSSTLTSVRNIGQVSLPHVRSSQWFPQH